MNKIKKRIIFELYITQAFFCPLSQNLNITRSRDSCLVEHPNVQCICKGNYSRFGLDFKPSSHVTHKHTRVVDPKHFKPDLIF